MPNLNISVPRYQPLDPYIHLIDNLPIDAIVEQIVTVNNQVDLNTSTLGQSIGTQGSLANRLSISIKPDGTLKTEAIDNALHSIEEHTDTENFVRMSFAQDSKLSFISPEATSLQCQINTISGMIPFVDNVLQIEPSDSISWRYEGGKMYADTAFPASVRHTHYYGLVPVTSDYENFVTTSVYTEYKEGSLRVYVNGVRLNQDHEVYVPFNQDSTVTYSLLKYTEGVATDGVVTGADFVLSDAISSIDSIVIDFDILY